MRTDLEELPQDSCLNAVRGEHYPSGSFIFRGMRINLLIAARSALTPSTFPKQISDFEEID